MLDLRVERISLWLCFLVCLAGVICGATNPPHPSFGNLIISVIQGINTRNTSGDAKMIYESGGCVQFSDTSGEPHIYARLYDTRTVRTILLYLPPGAEPSNIQMKAGSGWTVLTPFSKTDWPVTKEYSVYRWEGDVSAYDIRVAASQKFSICFMKVYDKTLEDYCECGDACHRNADVVCSGVCNKAVPDNCRMENVALNKTATMSTGHKGSSASSAVNGVTGTTFSAPGYNNDTTLWNCIHTAPGDNSPNWTVDLGRSYDFRYVTIYRRNTEKGRMKDVQIKVGDKVCKNITWYDARSDRMDLDCDEVMRGRMVTLTRSQKFLNFCELQIWVCKPGYYGTKCSSNCSGHCEGNSVCDGIYGTCPGECEPGWYTEKCSVECNPWCSDNGCNKTSGACFECRANFAGNKCKDCDNAHYGTDCSKQCGHCSKKDTPCGRKYGQCTWDSEIRGYCEAGYQRTKCTEKCSHGSYGIDCKHQCGSGCINGGCDPVTGHCSCRSGWKESNSKCDEPCDQGTYGKNCAGKCGPGCQRGNCNKETGYCDCKPGYQPSMCQEECPAEFFGQNCSRPCGKGCEDGQCHHESGQCFCRSGWTPDDTFCNTACDDGYHGNCSIKCGNCASDPVTKDIVHCDKESGHCPDKCEGDFMFPLCAERIQKEEEDESGGSSTTTVVIASVVFLLLCGLLAVGVFMYKRRKRASDPTSGSKLHPNHGEDRERLQAHIENDVHYQPGTSGNGGARCHVVTASASKRDEELLLDMDDIEEDEVAEDERWSVYQSIKVTMDPVQRHLLDMLTDLDSLKAEFKNLPAGMCAPHTVGSEAENKDKNRFKKLIAYDHSRVSLTLLANDPNSDYINANYIRNLQDEQAYIATQGPLSVTIGDFWRMVWEQNVTQIVMLTNLQEKDKVKCHQYWPEKGEQLNRMDLTIKGTDVQLRSDFFVRSFLVSKDKKRTPREVKQYHMVTWPDHGVPAALALVNVLRCVNADTEADSGPLLVHCSAGVGRTGTYLALDMMMQQPNPQKSNMDVFKTTKRMREDRVIMIQNVDQYVFLYEVLLEAYTSRNSRLKIDDLNNIFPTPISSRTENSRIDQEFSKLSQMNNFLSKPKYTMALMEENKAKNRDGTVLADDAHLVYLSVHVSGRNQYINAVSLSTFRQQRGMLLTQLPLPDTMVDLWRLVVGFDVTTIVSLGSKEEEKKKDYCHYWPRSQQSTIKAGPYVIKATSSEALSETLTSYKLTVERTGKETRHVNLLHLSSWAGETPDSTSDLLLLLERMDAIQSKATESPVIIQCRDGAKRSGLFAALSNIISRLTYDRQLDVYLTVRQVQHVRPQAITSKTQYRFCYEVALEYRKSFDIYANS